MEKYIYDEKNGLHYELVGDYYLPCLTIDEPEQPIGIWGQRRSHFLKEHKKIEYMNLLTTGKLNSHLVEVDQPVPAMYNRLMNQVCHSQDRIIFYCAYRMSHLLVEQYNILSDRTHRASIDNSRIA